MAFRLVIEGEPQELERYVREECYHIAREALVNAFSHSCAQAVEARLVYRARSMVIVVRDDGVGIEKETLDAGARKGHWGLPGMRERARLLGARLRIWSRSGSGTEIALAIPSRVAYAAPHTATAFRRWRFFRTHSPTR
jgi:signal transduction histidine kinase